MSKPNLEQRFHDRAVTKVACGHQRGPIIDELVDVALLETLSRHIDMPDSARDDERGAKGVFPSRVVEVPPQHVE